MATPYLTRSLLAITKQNPFATFCRSYTAVRSSVLPNSSSFMSRVRPLVATAASPNFRRLAPALSTRGFASRQTSSSLNDPNPNWSNRPPKETILLDGCDFEHWLVVMEKPEGEPTRDEIIDSYIKTLAMVVGSEEEARMKIYSVSTRHYFAFGALVSEELSYKLKELPKVRWVLPDSYLDVRNKDYGGEPFINGQAVPYDPKYHEEWVRNNARANERNRRNDRPRNFDRSRNFERRRDVQMNNQNYGTNVGGGPGGSAGGPSNMSAIPGNVPNTAAMQPNMQQQHNNMGGQSNYGGNMPPSNPGNYPPNVSNQYGYGPSSGGVPYPSGPGPNQNSFGPNRIPGPVPNPNTYTSNTSPPSAGQMGPPIPGQNPNMGPGPGQNPNMRPVPGQNPNMGPVPGQNPNMGPVPGQYQNSHPPNMGPGPGQNPNMGPVPGQYQNSHPPNMGPGPGQSPNMGPVRGQYQNGHTPNTGPDQGHNQSGYGQNVGGGSAYQNQNVPGRDFPLPSNY
ncbi:hypothetical protein F511_05787 [Dorcoceras hygrometricum]|uniref:MORF/ORRM1/DAG-like MORF domain-containing protein n=1 Tax=Dorcoceras hygrometricum TaxID=472368 RepID=A0A2Z7B687_9LAMI|nr:hypothetical protein F511_05787 [Dorcoceras hygrometricum]